MLLIHESLVQNLERYRHLIESAATFEKDDLLHRHFVLPDTQESETLATLKEKLEFKVTDLQSLNQRIQSYLLAKLP